MSQISQPRFKSVCWGKCGVKGHHKIELYMKECQHENPHVCENEYCGTSDKKQLFRKPSRRGGYPGSQSTFQCIVSADKINNNSDELSGTSRLLGKSLEGLDRIGETIKRKRGRPALPPEIKEERARTRKRRRRLSKERETNEQ